MKIEIKKTEKPYTCADCGAWVVGKKYNDKVGAPLCRYCADKANGQVRREPSIPANNKIKEMELNQQDINQIIERNRAIADQLLQLCNSCPHNGEDCLALDNQCPDR